MDVEVQDSASVEFMDAECDDDYLEKETEQHHSIICQIRRETIDNGAERTLNDINSAENSISSAVDNSDSFNSDKNKEEFSDALESLSVHTTSITISKQEHSETSESLSHDYLQDDIWRAQKKHIFILSEAGKPIYSLHGNEDKLATLFGIIQALVSFVQHGQDAITSIHARGIKFVFLVRNSLILVAASRTNISVLQLQMQLSDVYNQILSTLTYSHMTKIFEKRKNFDLRRLLSGSERLIYHLLANDSCNKRITNNVFTALTNTIRVLPLPLPVRMNIVSSIQTNCSKIKNLVFAILIADNKLITLVRMKKYSIHPADLRLIFNLIECSESFKASENWTPICLPKFDMNGYLHAHVSYLTDDCQACLLLLTVDRDEFFTLSDAKKRITEKLQRSHCLEAINEAMLVNGKLNINSIGLPELRHFLYKPKASAQLLCAELAAPYVALKEFERLESIYCDLLQRIHNNSRPLKLIYEVKESEVALAWVTASYELYAVFEPIFSTREPMVDKSVVIKYVDKLIKWIEKEYDTYFIRNHPTF